MLTAEALEMLGGRLGSGCHRGAGGRSGGGGRAAFLPSVPNTGMTVGNDFEATTMEIKGMRM